jgi:hypothetical protein
MQIYGNGDTKIASVISIVSRFGERKLERPSHRCAVDSTVVLDNDSLLCLTGGEAVATFQEEQWRPPMLRHSFSLLRPDYQGRPSFLQTVANKE